MPDALKRFLVIEFSKAMGQNGTVKGNISSKQKVREERGYLRRFIIKSSGKNVFVDTSEIWWIESSGNYVEIHVENNRYLIRGSLKKMEEKLDPNEFVRIHQSTLVNVNKIKYTEPSLYGSYEVVLQDEHKLKMSRTYKDALDEYQLEL